MEVNPDNGPEVYTRCNAVIFDAMHILKCLGYLPVLVRKSKIPLDLIGIRPEPGALVIEVVRSRTPLRMHGPWLPGAGRKSVSPRNKALVAVPEDALGVFAASAGGGSTMCPREGSGWRRI